MQKPENSDETTIPRRLLLPTPHDYYMHPIPLTKELKTKLLSHQATIVVVIVTVNIMFSSPLYLIHSSEKIKNKKRETLGVMESLL